MERKEGLLEVLESFFAQASDKASNFFTQVYMEAKNHSDLVNSAGVGFTLAVTLITILSYFPGEPFSYDNSKFEGDAPDSVGELLKGAAEAKITEEDEKNAEEKIVHSRKLQKLLGMSGLFCVSRSIG